MQYEMSVLRLLSINNEQCKRTKEIADRMRRRNDILEVPSAVQQAGTIEVVTRINTPFQSPCVRAWNTRQRIKNAMYTRNTLHLLSSKYPFHPLNDVLLGL